jgi:hypothetical protein
MGIEIRWDNDEKTIIRETYNGRWTWDDFYLRITGEVPPMMKSVNHRVDVIADFRPSGPLPVGPAITNARNVIRSMPENWGCLVIVTDNRFIRVMVDTFRKLFSTGMGAKTFTAATPEEAYQVIARYQPTITTKSA